uniref:Uncharacterized protein n=1 Tax=Arundo donax TaxID=35708 RepID=A0A0A9G1C0_ARUDO
MSIAEIILEPSVCMVSHLHSLIHLIPYMTRTDPLEKDWKGLKKQLVTWRMKIQMKLEMRKWRRCRQDHLVAPWLQH